MNPPSVSPLTRGSIFQVGYVVPDIASARRYFESNFGIGPWLDPPKPTLEDRMYHCEPNPEADDEVSFAWVGDLQIELVEPVAGPSVFTDFLAENPQGGMHHFDWLVDDFDGSVAALGGIEAAAQSARIGDMRYAIFDTPGFGGMVELLYMDEATKKLFGDFLETLA